MLSVIGSRAMKVGSANSPVDAVRNIAVAVQAALLLRRHDDLKNREIVTDFGAI